MGDSMPAATSAIIKLNQNARRLRTLAFFLNPWYDAASNESIGRVKVDGGSKVIKALGGSTTRVEYHEKRLKEESGLQSVYLSRKLRGKLLKQILAKVSAQDYDILTHLPSSGWFTDCFEIEIYNGDSSYRVKIDGGLSLKIVTENTVFWFDFFIDCKILHFCAPQSRRMQKILDSLRSQILAPHKDELSRLCQQS
ncbi:MAG: hypothetical protein Q8P49_03525 [Candidatus Liptonbacteria bacterium]|nr:hypothetical protein [Candidatus Liptonbacteria bacterium]